MHDILISGGGIAGLSLALGLRLSYGTGLRIGLIDPAFGSRQANVRTSALTAGSRNLLQALGVWPEMARHAQPILTMKITDSRRNDAVRPLFLTFDEPLDDGSPFAWMVQNADLVTSLETMVTLSGIDLYRSAVSRIVDKERNIDLRLADGQSLSGALLVGADGVQSKVRRACGIETVGRDYHRTAMVATFAHEEDHCGVATQHFLPSGPFAMLPLTGRRASIVWTEPAADAQGYLAMPDDEFTEEVERRFGLSLGRLRLVSRPAGFPLRVHIARRFTARRAALIGDAAHLIHPLAGQGLNLGLRDVASLVGLLGGPIRLGLDPGGADVLAQYERARYFDSVAMIAGTDGLHRLFANDSLPLRFIRDLGLGIVNRLPRLKRGLIREAAGLSGDTPAMLRGQLP